jgi:hopanoid-associated phosphorylase
MILAAVGMLREARIVRGPHITAVAGGGRADLLLERLAAAAHEATGVLSIGLGGALDAQLAVGDTAIASEVIGDGRWPADEAWADRLAQRLPGARRSVVYGSDRMITKAVDKAVLHTETGAALADMESHIAARFAAGHGLPLAVVRVISDTADADLPQAVTRGLKPDGGMNLLGVLAALAADPRQMPALIRAGHDAETAFRALRALTPRLAL